MILFHGRRKVRIKKFDNQQIRCENCGGSEHRVSVYQEYFHLFFIPVYPSGRKTIEIVCQKCKYSFGHQNSEYYLSKTRTPIYLYTGIILVVGVIITAIFGYNSTQKQKKEFVNNPKVGDVYQFRQDENNNTIYYFLKIKEIDSDTVELLHGYLQYSDFVSTMNNSDYFVKADIFSVSKTDLRNFLDSGWIN